jgi:hypothetical protein
LSGKLEPMRLLSVRAVLLLAVLGGFEAKAGDGPPPGTAPEFCEAWLRFHESDLCESLDVVFVFRPRSLEVWVAPGDEKEAQKLREQLGALRSAGRLEFYAPRAPAEPKSTAERTPPPGLWNNGQLRQYLQDPFHSARLSDPGPAGEDPSSQNDRSLRLRMLSYADQLLEWSVRLRRFAEHLPDLSVLAFSPATPAGLRTRAVSSCNSHLREVERLADRLQKSLEPAIPKADRRGQTKAAAQSSLGTLTSEAAIRKVASEAGTIARRTRRFLFPRTHTVGLEDLKDPDLLWALRSLRADATAILSANGSPRQ